MYMYIQYIYPFRIIFWITGKDILRRYLNGLELQTCVTLASEPLALTLDVEKKYLYWLTFDNNDNTAVLSQMEYTRNQCGTRCYI